MHNSGWLSGKKRVEEFAPLYYDFQAQQMPAFLSKVHRAAPTTSRKLTPVRND